MKYDLRSTIERFTKYDWTISEVRLDDLRNTIERFTKYDLRNTIGRFTEYD
jgi:hypothetical protein